jgi:hypothetical protein
MLKQRKTKTATIWTLSPGKRVATVSAQLEDDRWIVYCGNVRISPPMRHLIACFLIARMDDSQRRKQRRVAMTFDPMEKAKDLADQISSIGNLYRIAWKSRLSKSPRHLRFGEERIVHVRLSDGQQGRVGGRGTLGYMRDGVLTTSNGHTGTYRRLKEFAGIFHDQHEVEIRINCTVFDGETELTSISGER